MHDLWTVKDPVMRAGEQVNFLKNVALAGAVFALVYGAASWPLTIS